MSLHELTPDNQAILKGVRLDYFWQRIPFYRLRTALDVGAHIGLWSTVCHEIARNIEITAIEPHPDNYHQLKQNCPYVTTIRGYCGYTPDLDLCCRPAMEGSHYVLRTDEHPAQDSYVLKGLPCYSLEEFGAIDLLKLDCEGSEFDILLNCAPDTLQRIQVIVGEYHQDRGDVSDLITRLTACGFAMDITPSSDAPHLGHFLAKRREE